MTRAHTTTRRAPERGRPVEIPGSYLGQCTFYRVHVGRSGAVSWLVIDRRCRQFHACRPEQVRINRKRALPCR